jgi:hypothetical protein
MKLFYQYSQQERPSSIVLEAKPEATLNLLPVDVAIRAMWALSPPRAQGKIFHITHPPLDLPAIDFMAERIRFAYPDLRPAPCPARKIGRTVGTETASRFMPLHVW